MASDDYLLAIAKDSRLAALDEIGIDDLRDQKIISFSRQNLSYTERYFAEMFAEYDLARNIAYTCDDTFALISLVSAGLGIGFAPQWTRDFPTVQWNKRRQSRRSLKIHFRHGETDDVAQFSPAQETKSHKAATCRPRQFGR
jgi:DNA-binding transcriptional LysR family regulator